MGHKVRKKSVVDMINVVHADVKSDAVSPSNVLPRWVWDQITDQISELLVVVRLKKKIEENGGKMIFPIKLDGG